MSSGSVYEPIRLHKQDLVARVTVASDSGCAVVKRGRRMLVFKCLYGFALLAMPIMLEDNCDRISIDAV